MFNFKIIFGNKYYTVKKEKPNAEKPGKPKRKHTELEQGCCCVSNEDDKHSKHRN